MASQSTSSAGSACTTFAELIKRIESIPAETNSGPLSSSKALISLFNSPKHLHVHTLGASVDELLHAGVLIHDHHRRARSSSTRSGPAGGAILIVDDDDAPASFAAVAALAAHITGEAASRDPNTDADTAAFAHITVVRGHAPPRACAGPADYTARLAAATARARSALVRLSQKHAAPRVVWHAHGDPALLVRLLASADRATTKRHPLAAIVAFDALQEQSSSPSSSSGTGERDPAIALPHPHPAFAANLPNPWPALLRLSRDLNAQDGGIPVAFLAGPALRTQLQRHSVQHLVGLRDHFPALLPETAWKPHLGRVLDQLLVGAFRLLAQGGGSAQEGREETGMSGAQAVRELKRRVHGDLARGWAKLCVDEASYGREECWRTAEGALPALALLTLGTSNSSEAPLPTLAAFVYTITNPSPGAAANALNRLVVGACANTESSLWGLRCAVSPVAGGPAVAVKFASSGGNLFIVTPKDPKVTQVQVGERWAGYMVSVRHRQANFKNASGDGFGVGKETARAWLAVVPGVFVDVIKEWARRVRMELKSAEDKTRLDEGVAAVETAARKSPFTKACEKTVGTSRQ